jgi:hypothetical protein
MIDHLEQWWREQGGLGHPALRAAFALARRRAAVSRPWYNLKNRHGHRVGLWHDVEELERRTTLFNSEEAWLEWTWLVYGPDGIIEPVLRAWSSSLNSQPGIARAGGFRAFPKPLKYHPSIIRRIGAVWGQTTPDPQRPGMLLRGMDQ